LPAFEFVFKVVTGMDGGVIDDVEKIEGYAFFKLEEAIDDPGSSLHKKLPSTKLDKLRQIVQKLKKKSDIHTPKNEIEARKD